MQEQDRRAGKPGKPGREGAGAAAGKAADSAAGKPADSAATERRVQELMKTYGLPEDLARQVAAGQLDINGAVTKLAMLDDIKVLMEQHKFDRALATQIAMGHVSREEMILKQQVFAQIRKTRHFTIFDRSKMQNKEVTLAVHGRRYVQGIVQKNHKYEFDILLAGTETVERLHKLEVKCGWWTEDTKKVRKGMTWDAARKAREGVVPVEKPQDRYACSDRRLGTAMVRGVDVRVVLVEGEVFSGKIDWVSRYEFALMTRQGVKVKVLRHALDDMSGDDWKRKD